MIRKYLQLFPQNLKSIPNGSERIEFFLIWKTKSVRSMICLADPWNTDTKHWICSFRTRYTESVHSEQHGIGTIRIGRCGRDRIIVWIGFRQQQWNRKCAQVEIQGSGMKSSLISSSYLQLYSYLNAQLISWLTYFFVSRMNWATYAHLFLVSFSQKQLLLSVN